MDEGSCKIVTVLKSCYVFIMIFLVDELLGEVELCKRRVYLLDECFIFGLFFGFGFFLHYARILRRIWTVCTGIGVIWALKPFYLSKKGTLMRCSCCLPRSLACRRFGQAALTPESTVLLIIMARRRTNPVNPALRYLFLLKNNKIRALQT